MATAMEGTNSRNLTDRLISTTSSDRGRDADFNSDCATDKLFGPRNIGWT